MSEHHYKDQMIKDRRWLHEHPEEGWCEFETTYFIVKRIEELGLKALCGIEVIEPTAVMGRNEETVAEAVHAIFANWYSIGRYPDQFDG